MSTADDIASLRASVERLTRERDEAVKLVPDLREALGTAHARVESAEATIARLGMVVRAAEDVRCRVLPLVGEYDSDPPSWDELRSALAALAPEDRRRAGIEG